MHATVEQNPGLASEPDGSPAFRMRRSLFVSVFSPKTRRLEARHCSVWHDDIVILFVRCQDVPLNHSDSLIWLICESTLTKRVETLVLLGHRAAHPSRIGHLTTLVSLWSTLPPVSPAKTLFLAWAMARPRKTSYNTNFFSGRCVALYVRCQRWGLACPWLGGCLG